MRAVIYSDTFEPLTVVELSPWMIHRFENRDTIVFPVYPRIKVYEVSCNNSSPTIGVFHNVEIRAEWFERKGKRYFFLFTDNVTQSLLINSTLLPGQDNALEKVKEDAFYEGFAEALRILHLKENAI